MTSTTSDFLDNPWIAYYTDYTLKCPVCNTFKTINRYDVIETHNRIVMCEECYVEQVQKEAQKAEREIIKESINQANIEISDSFFGEVCDECNAHIEPALHHWIDQFYKNIMSKLKEISKADDTHSPQVSGGLAVTSSMRNGCNSEDSNSKADDEVQHAKD